MSGSTGTVELYWFPRHPNRFITWGAEVNLYQVKNTEDIDTKISTNINLDISNQTTASLLAAETRYQYIRCVAPSFRGDLTTAIGLANGKVGLCNFVSSTENNIEFTPKQSRPCVCLAWHETETNLLAIGHDRNRSDHCITVWDTERGVPKEKATLNLIGLSETAHSLCWDKQSKILVSGMSHKYIKLMDLRQSNPLVTVTNTRAVHGLSISSNGRFLASYVDNMVTLWDFRNIEKPISIQNMEKNVGSINWCSTRLSTLSILQRDSQYVQLMDLYCPPITMTNTIATTTSAITTTAASAAATLSTSLSSSSNSNMTNNTTQSIDLLDVEPHSIKRIVAPFQGRTMINSRVMTLSGISWHPIDCERMLALSGSGQICDFRVQQRVAISFDPFNNLCGSNGVNLTCLNTPSPPTTPIGDDKSSTSSSSSASLLLSARTPWIDSSGVIAASSLISTHQQHHHHLQNQHQQNNHQQSQQQQQQQQQHHHQFQSDEEDIADIIHRRALNDYGKLLDIQKNGDLAQNSKLKPVWQLLALTNNLEDSFAGLKAILGITGVSDLPPMYHSETAYLQFIDYPLAPTVKIFKSSQREESQHLCGWTFERNNKEGFQTFIDNLCAKQEYTRAALICCFQLKIRYAIEILGAGADRSNSLDTSNYRMAAIALSGLNFEKNTLWRSQCMAAHSQINDPYLRAMFSFLTPDNDHSYDTVLQETGVSVSDRMAFACQYLCDTKLAEYVIEMIKSCINSGDLKGLLLTGATIEGVELLQSYLDWTEDVQTVALVSIKFLSKELISDSLVQYWITSYRELLDIWGLWEQRAHFDMILGQIRSPPKYSRSVFLLCSFCGKSVSACLQEESRMRSTSSNVNKLSSCPNCRKPLPRCSLCLLHMGTTTGAMSSTGQQQNTPPGGHTTTFGWQSKPFSKWFSWCQSCRHGGHTEHLTEWFAQHSECPVASCTCKCNSLDLPIPQFNKAF